MPVVSGRLVLIFVRKWAAVYFRNFVSVLLGFVVSQIIFENSLCYGRRITRFIFFAFFAWQDLVDYDIKTVVRFFMMSCQLIMSDLWWRYVGTVLTLKIFHPQILTNLLQIATEMVRFLKRFKSWVFPEKHLNFFQISKGGKIAVECVSNDTNSQKCFFHCTSNFSRIS